MRRLIKNFRIMKSCILLGCLLAISLLVSCKDGESKIDITKLDITKVDIAKIEAEIQTELSAIESAGDPVNPARLNTTPPPPDKNAATYYRLAFDAMSKIGYTSLRGEVYADEAKLDDPAFKQKADALLAESSSTLALIHKAAAMPECDFEHDWTNSHAGIELAWGVFPKLRECASWLAFEAVMLSHEGKADEALATCETYFLLSNALDAPFIAGQFDRFSIIEGAFHSTGALLDRANPSPKACKSLLKSLESMEISDAYIAALKGDRAINISLLDKLQLLDDPKEIAEALRDLYDLESDQKRRLPPIPEDPEKQRAMLACGELIYLISQRHSIADTRQPYYQAMKLLPTLQEEMKAENSNLDYFIASSRRAAIISDDIKARDTAIAQLELTRTALHLKLHYAKHGTYPKVTDLLSGFGHSYGIDPFSGKPLIYQREQDGFTLYSIGPDLHDNGGNAKDSTYINEGDIVFRVKK